MPACAWGQVAHEDPGLAVPSRSEPIDGMVESLMESMMASLGDVSSAVEGGNFTAARASYSAFHSSLLKYGDLLWQLNLSDSDYRSLADQMNFTDGEIRAIIDGAEAYEINSGQYGQAVSGDPANSSSYAARARDNYSVVSSSYGGLRHNATLLGRILTDRGLDTGRLDSSIGTLDRLMARYNATYRNLSAVTNGSTLSLNVDRNSLSVGDAVTFRAALKDASGMPMGGEKVSAYVDGVLAGSFVTDFGGEGSVKYIIPVNVSGDHLLARAEHAPLSGPIVVSNTVDLYIQGLPAAVTLGLDRDSASFGDTVGVTGRLAAGGRPMPYRAIEILLNGSPAGTAHTDKDGSYSYALPVGPTTPAGLFTVNARYYRKPGDLLLNSTSDDKALSIYARPTRLTLVSPDALSPGSVAGFTGSLTTENSSPVAGANITVYIDGAEAGNGTTGPDGGYSVTAIVPRNASPDGYNVYTGFSPGAGKALLESSSVPALIPLSASGQKPGIWNITLEQAMLAGAFTLLVVAMAAILLYHRSAVRKQEKSMEATVTGPIESHLAIEKETFNIEEEIVNIRSSMAGPDLRAATTQAYLAARKLLARAGLRLDDSMTHHEAYRAAAARFPETAKPLKHIVELYEKAVFAGQQPGPDGLELNINSLREVAAYLSAAEAGL